MLEPPTAVDFFWVIQQPLLWVGLLLLAWRGRSLGMMRLLIDTLIVVLAAVVLSWTVVLEKRLLDPDATALAKAVAIYYPVFDIAHLFCALMLIANVRERPGLARASAWLLCGVLCLIVTDSVNSYFSLNPFAALSSPLLDVSRMWSYVLIGMAALIHAGVHLPEVIAGPSGLEDAVEPALLPRTVDDRGTDWDSKLVRWHRAGMLWLPYVATLGVSGVLIGQEMRKSSDSLQRLLPVVSLLLAIVARQMLTLWDNLQLSERLRASNADLERNVDERTRHLATLHGITSTLNTSLDRRTVLRVTLEKTILAVHADGGGIWLRQIEGDPYSGQRDEWILVHWQGLESEPHMPAMLRDLSIAAADEGGDNFVNLSPETRVALQDGTAPPSQRLILVPVRWQGQLLGVMSLVRMDGSFSYEDRALVESVALEAGTALQNARLYSDASRRADRDSVTDLFNHRAAQEQLNATLARCKRSTGQFAIVMMDLNNFKFFNDTYGHPVGDEVLRTVARALRESCRTSDMLGRYGGDEFIAVLPDTDASGTIEVCQRIAASLDARHFEPVPGTKLPISISFGWAVYPQDGENALELLTQADANLYNHKRGGASYLTQRARAAKEGKDELKKLKNRAWGGSFGVLDALVTAIDNKDHYTRHHSEEVTYLSLLVAKDLNFSPEALRAVRISGLLHDVGKIAVPDHILRHPGKLGKEEWDIMQQHPVFGALIVKDVPNLEEVLGGIRHHHEKWDGTGYPDRLSGTDIPLLGRLLAMADVYSALTTDRPYRKGWKPEAALEEIERSSGSHFDPHLCEVFIRVMRRELASLGDGFSDYSLRISESFDDTPVDSGPVDMRPAEPVQGLAENEPNFPRRLSADGGMKTSSLMGGSG
jgi:diguanylate cyclase (GGDEF)-like protein